MIIRNQAELDRHINDITRYYEKTFGTVNHQMPTDWIAQIGCYGVGKFPLMATYSFGTAFGDGFTVYHAFFYVDDAYDLMLEAGARPQNSLIMPTAW